MRDFLQEPEFFSSMRGKTKAKTGGFSERVRPSRLPEKH
jgi:hypothetical protein